MFVVNHTGSLHIVPRMTMLKELEDGTDEVAQYETVQFPPGPFEVEPDLWRFLVENDAMFKHYLDEGHFEELGEDGPSKMKESQAVKLIKSTTVDELLARWQRQEKRPKVRKAITDQREVLKIHPPKDGVKVEKMESIE